MKIAVCDDEAIFRDQIIENIYSLFGKLDTNCVEFKDGQKLVDSYQSGQEYEAIFLDIEMPELDGMKTAAQLREMGIYVPIIFLTSHTELAMEGYEVSAFRFLAKPIQIEKLEQTLYMLKEELCEKKKLMIRYEGEDVILTVDDIIYVEAMNNSISIVMKDQKYVIRKKINDIEKELQEISDAFVRVHRGYIVNLGHVKKQSGNEVSMANGMSLPISRSLAGTFKKRLFEYVRSHTR